MKPTVSSKLVLLALSSILILGTNAKAAVIYSETFPNSTGSNIALNTSGINWNSYTGNTATNTSSNTAPSSSFVVSGGVGSGGSAGFVLKQGGTGKALAYTTDFTPVNRSSTELASFSFDLNNNNTTDAFFVAIQLDVSGTPTWYLSATSFTASVAQTWESKTLTFSTAAAQWYSLTVDPGVSLSVGSVLSSPLPSGNLIGAGLYSTSGAIAGGGSANPVRFDNFEIVTVPEPSAVALIGIGAVAMMLRRARQRPISIS